MSLKIELRRIEAGPETEAAVQRVCEAAADYMLRISGLPPGKSYEDKFTYGVFEGNKMVGCAELIRGWREPDSAHIGLLPLVPEARGRGTGGQAVAALEREARAWRAAARASLSRKAL
ncbi:MAG TPA: GNAT family N-acetyltransferase [Methylibium sp.]